MNKANPPLKFCGVKRLRDKPNDWTLDLFPVLRVQRGWPSAVYVTVGWLLWRWEFVWSNSGWEQDYYLRGVMPE
jgi:hypothetical protein